MTRGHDDAAALRMSLCEAQQQIAAAVIELREYREPRREVILQRAVNAQLALCALDLSLPQQQRAAAQADADGYDSDRDD